MPETVAKPRKIQIQETAENLFKERGYAATSMRSLASELGIEPASLYSHIKSKEDILIETCFRMATAFFKKIEEVKSQDLSYTHKLEMYIIGHINVLLENQNATAVFFQDWKFLTEPRLSEFKSLRRDYEDEFKAVMRAGNETGEFHIDDINFTTQTIFSAMNMTHEWYRPAGNLHGDEVGKKLADLLLNGIANL